MEHLQPVLPRPTVPQVHAVPVPDMPAVDLARVADAGSVVTLADSTDPIVTIAVKTTGRAVARIAATADTPVGEILGRACAELRVTDPERYSLIVNGEVIEDLDQTIGEIVGAKLDTTLATWLVKRPEAGTLAA